MKKSMSAKKDHDPIETQDVNVTLQTKDICEICKKNKIENIHHFDLNHKNNNQENLQYLCTLCHAKIHNTSPIKSELKRLVILSKRLEKLRVMVNNCVVDLERIEYAIPEDFKKINSIIEKNEEDFKKQYKTLLNSGKFEVYDKFLKEIKGIGPSLAGQLISYIDNIQRFKSVASLWHYFGMHVKNGKAPKRVIGSMIDWNPDCRRLCYSISDSFMKHRTPKYREIYDKTKEIELTKVTKGHAHNRALRKSVKSFLKDLWIEWNKLEKIDICGENCTLIVEGTTNDAFELI